MGHTDNRHFKHADSLGAAQAGIPDDDVAVFVDEDRHEEAERANAPSDLLELPIGVLARVAGIAPERARRHPLDEQVGSEISEHLFTSILARPEPAGRGGTL